MPQLLGLIFDLDGTLVDSAADLQQALNAVLAKNSRRALNLTEVKGMIGDGSQTLLRRAWAATGQALPDRGAQDTLQDFLKTYQSQKASVDQLYPHVVDTLTHFRRKDIKVGLCTNKLYQPTVKLLADIGITELFDYVAGSDTFSVYKPHPGHVMGVVRALGLSPETCAMIGDSINDIRSAQGAGVLSLAVSHGYASDVRQLGADAVLNQFTDLDSSLRKLGFEFAA